MIGTENNFIIFQDVSWGIRALATDIANAWKKGYNSVGAFITHYAPPSENDTAAYIAAVSQDTGFDPNLAIALDTGSLQSLVRAIMNHELGAEYSAMVTDDDIAQGISMMNNALLTWLQAVGIAVTTTVGGGSNSGLVLGLVAAGVALYYFTRKQKH